MLHEVQPASQNFATTNSLSKATVATEAIRLFSIRTHLCLCAFSIAAMVQIHTCFHTTGIQPWGSLTSHKLALDTSLWVKGEDVVCTSDLLFGSPRNGGPFQETETHKHMQYAFLLRSEGHHKSVSRKSLSYDSPLSKTHATVRTVSPKIWLPHQQGSCKAGPHFKMCNNMTVAFGVDQETEGQGLCKISLCTQEQILPCSQVSILICLVIERGIPASCHPCPKA